MGRGAGKGGRDATPWMAGDKQRLQGFTSSPDRPVSFSLEVSLVTSHLRAPKKNGASLVLGAVWMASTQAS